MEAPFEWTANLNPGIYEFGARAVDYAGNEADAEVVVIGVDMEVPDPGGTGGTGGTDSGTGGGDTDGNDQSGGKDGCGCTTTEPVPLGAGLVLLGLVALRRRRVA
jgi:MYXO-CTERM domain-containing protein